MGNPLPGTVVPTSSLVTPGGPQGPSGATAAIETYTAPGLGPGFSQRWQVRSDFTDPLNSTIQANGQVSYGPIPWYLNGTAVAGAGVLEMGSGGGQDIFNKAYGVWALQSGGTNGNYETLTPNYPSIIAGLGALDIYFRIAFGRIPSAGNVLYYYMGLSDGPSTTANSIYLRMQWETGLSNCGWMGISNKASTPSTTSATATPAIVAFSSSAFSYYNCRISINAAWTSVSFYANNVLIGTLTTNIPAAGTLLYPWIYCGMGTPGASQASLYVDDYFLDYQYALP